MLYQKKTLDTRGIAAYILSVTIILVGVIHFYIYEHFWFLRLLGLDIYAPKINYVFLLPLFYAAVIYQLAVSINTKYGGEVSKTGSELAVTAFLYFVFSIFTVILHELDSGLLMVIKYSFYLFIPVMLSLSVFAIFRDNEDIKRTVFVLFLLGIIFSAYATVLNIKIMADIESFYDAFSFDGKIWTGKSAAWLSRFSVPGLGPTNFPSMLIPLILAGIYFYRNSDGKVKPFIYACASLFLLDNIVRTSTRGAFISLLIGVSYLFMKGWFKIKNPLSAILIFTSIVLIFFVDGEALLGRFLSTISQFIPSISELDVIHGLIEEGQSKGYACDDIHEEKNRGMMLVHAVQPLYNSFVFGIGFSGASSHIMYVDVLIRGGLVSLVPLVLFLLSIYRNSRAILHKRLYKDAFSKDFGTVLIAIFLSYTAEQMFMPAFVNNYWIWFGFAAAWARNCEMGYGAQVKVSGAVTTQA